MTLTRHITYPIKKYKHQNYHQTNASEYILKKIAIKSYKCKLVLLNVSNLQQKTDTPIC